MSNQNSWVITGCSYAVAMVVIALQVVYKYEVTNETWNLIALIVGSSTAGGIVNASRKHILSLKKK